MPQPIALVGVSQTDHGATIAGPGGITQFADATVVSIDGDLLTPHYHGGTLVTGATLISGSLDTFVDGRPLVRIGDTATCSCVVILGDEDTFCL